MGLRRKRILDFGERIAETLVGLGSSGATPWFDGNLGAGGEGTGAGGRVVRVRAPTADGSPEAVAADDGHWLCLGEQGGTLASLRRGAAKPEIIATSAPRCTFSVRDETVPEDVHARKGESFRASSLELVVDGSRKFLVGEWWARDAEVARARAEAARDHLCGWLGVNLVGPESGEFASAQDASRVLSATAMSRLVLRREGSVLVLRDMASRGPREPAGFELTSTFVLLFATIGLGWAAWSSGDSLLAAILGVVAVVVGLACYASAHIARHSFKYQLHNEALLYLGADRFVLAPWVSREGVVDDKPQGRYGAALPHSEWRDVAVRSSGGVHRLVLSTDHGEYEICAFDDSVAAGIWRDYLMQCVADLQPESSCEDSVEH